MRRSALEIDIAILQALSAYSPLKLTHLMYKANLNCNLLKARLSFLEEKGLIKLNKVQRMHLYGPGRAQILYGLTPEGMDVLRNYHSVYLALGSS